MILERRTLFFKSASIILDDARALAVAKHGGFSSVVVLSYKKLDLPGFAVASKPTLLINLERSEEDIFRDFNDTTRNEIRKTDNLNGLRIAKQERPDDASYLLYQKFEYSQGRTPVAKEAVDHSVFWGAYYDNELISGMYVTRSRPYLRIRSIFSQRLTTEDKERYKLIGYSTRRLVWEICRWGREDGFVSLDLASVNINNPETQSIARFKMSFGKDLTEEYIYTYKSKLFIIFERAVVIKLFLRKIIFKLKSLFS